MSSSKTSGGLVGIWSDEHKVLEAARKVREAGFERFDTISPFPIHGMDDAMGLRRSKIPIISFIGGALGLAAGLGLQTYIFVYDWPLNIGGKPFFSLPAFIPIVFEVTVLFSALITAGTMFCMCGLPRLDPPIIDPSLTDDKFAIYIPENDRGYDVSKIDSLFNQLGAEEIRKVGEF